MKLALTMGAAVAALTLAAAAAQPAHTRTIMRHGGGDAVNIDADSDGWVSRAEASAAADRVFDELDSNDDGRLTGEDRRAFEDFDIDIDVDVDVDELRAHALALAGEEDGDRRIVIRRGGELSEADEARIEREVARAEAQAERAEAAAERAAARAEAQADRASRDAIRHAREAARDGQRHVTREVIVIRADGDDHYAVAPTPPTPPVPPIPPRPPMFMMLIANSEEADLNTDGAISREEFRAQHLRFFDASDANGDGRIRFEAPPAPPAPPEPPTPPAPPRHR